MCPVALFTVGGNYGGNDGGNKGGKYGGIDRRAYICCWNAFAYIC